MGRTPLRRTGTPWWPPVNPWSRFENVVKSSIFLSEMENFNEVNEVYGSYFENESAPARETVAVKTLPKNVRVEISMIAVK